MKPSQYGWIIGEFKKSGCDRKNEEILKGLVGQEKANGRALKARRV